MSRLPNVIPVTDLRQDAAAVLRKVKADTRPTIITQRGRAAAVLVSIETYERSEEEHAILRRLAAGEREVMAGEGVDLDDVLADADALLDAQVPE